MEMDLLTLETIKTIFSNVEMDRDDAIVLRDNLNAEVDKQGEMTMRYGFLWAQSGKLKLLAERQVKKVRAQVELEYRSGVRGDIAEKKTEAGIKAMVESDVDVEMAELIEVEAVYWYNVCLNYYNAISQRMDLIRIIHKDISRDATQYAN